MNRWYVINTQSQGEERAAFNLRNQGFEVFLPRLRKQRRHARKVEQVLRPMFPGYLFVQLDLTRQQWRSINGTIGVSYLMCAGSEPAAVPAGVVEEICRRQDETGAICMPSRKLRAGQRVGIETGAFAEYEGLFEEQADENRIVLLLNILGREVRTHVHVNLLATTS